MEGGGVSFSIHHKNDKNDKNDLNRQFVIISIQARGMEGAERKFP